MSYMNYDTDPFGIPYSTTCVVKKTKETKKYTFENLKKLHKEQRELEQELFDIETEKNKAIEYLQTKLEKYVDDFAKIKFKENPYLKCEIHVKRLDLNKLEKMKEDFDINNIQVEVGPVIGEIIISLEW